MLKKKSRQYATALYTLAGKYGLTGEFHKSLKILVSLNSENPIFRRFFFSVKVSPQEKVSLLGSILGDDVHRLVLEFLGLLAEKKEQELLRDTFVSYDLQYKTEKKVVSVMATTALPLEEVEIKQIYQRLEEILEKHVDMKTEVDPLLLGGLKLRIGNVLLDSSVTTQLEKMKQSLL